MSKSYPPEDGNINLLYHPENGNLYNDYYIRMYANVVGVSAPVAIGELLDVGFVFVELDGAPGDDPEDAPVLPAESILAKSVERIAENTERAVNSLEAIAKQVVPVVTDLPRRISAVIPDAIYTVEEVAKLIRISISEAHGLTQDGTIPCMRIGRGGRTKRVLGRDVLAYLESSKLRKPDTKYQLKHLG